MKALIERLNKIQREMKAVKGRSDPSGKFAYRNAEDLMQAAKPYLGTSTVIICTDEIREVAGKAYMVSKAAITDGTDSLSATGWAQVPDKIMAMSAPQISGSCSSYARKYALQALLLTDNNPDIDSAAQYAEEYERFVDCLNNREGFKLYYLTCDMPAEAHAAVWNMLKQEYIPKGEIGQYRQIIADLKEIGRRKALEYQEAFDDPDDSIAAEAMAEFTKEEQEFIRGIEA